MKMNQVLSAIFVSAALVSGSLSFADESHPAADPVTANQTEKKPSRKKKVEMCSECGKPEKECECHGKDKKKDVEKNAEAQH